MQIMEYLALAESLGGLAVIVYLAYQQYTDK